MTKGVPLGHKTHELTAKGTDSLVGGERERGSPAPSLWIEIPFSPYPRSSRATPSWEEEEEEEDLWILHTSSTPLLPHLTGEMCVRRGGWGLGLGFRV